MSEFRLTIGTGPDACCALTARAGCLGSPIQTTRHQSMCVVKEFESRHIDAETRACVIVPTATIELDISPATVLAWAEMVRAFEDAPDDEATTELRTVDDLGPEVAVVDAAGVPCVTRPIGRIIIEFQEPTS